MKIATVHNVTPIKGTTIILCNLGFNMSRPCTSARGMGRPRQISEIAVLLGLMCKHSCEESQFIVYGSGESRKVELEKGTILNNMDSVLRLQTVRLYYSRLFIIYLHPQLKELLYLSATLLHCMFASHRLLMKRSNQLPE